MAVVVGSKFKWCGNCVYWGGARTLNGALGYMELPNEQNAKGPCAKNLGWTECPYLSTCNQFEKHPGVR